jgi:MHS family proline/betaine transporter-like MFS transporter
MRVKSIIGGSIGNILEWYDFGLFAIYSPLFTRLFFPHDDPHVAIITIFSVFAVGFLCRPLGALIFGYLGDKTGRVKTLRLSILMISIPTLLIGCLPTYSLVGLWAPVLLLLIRIWQGISLGGEFSGTIIYLTETAPKQRRGAITSLAGTGANIGILLAAAVSAICSHFLVSDSFVQWGWRIPYLISGMICLFVFISRFKMQETSSFCFLKENKLLASNPIKVTFKQNIPHMLKTVGLVCMGSTFYYLCFIYMPTFLMENLQFTISKATNLMTFFVGFMILLVPLAGMLCDRFGRRRMLLFNSVVVALIAVPGFYLLLNSYVASLLLILTLFTIASSLEQATTSIAVVENYPSPARYTGLSFGYNVGVAIFGGTTPLICQWLINKTHMALIPAFYIVGCALITGLVAFFFVQETEREGWV